MATIEQVEQLAQEILNAVESLHATLTIAASQIVVVGGLSDIDTNLGTVLAGEFQTGNLVPPGHGFSGMRMAYPAMTYDSAQWHLVGVNNDVLQFGVNADDGKLYAGGGDVVLDTSGLTLTAPISESLMQELSLIQWKNAADIYPMTIMWNGALAGNEGLEEPEYRVFKIVGGNTLDTAHLYASHFYISQFANCSGAAGSATINLRARRAYDMTQAQADIEVRAGDEASINLRATDVQIMRENLDPAPSAGGNLLIAGNLTVSGTLTCDDFYTFDPAYAVAWTAATTNPTLGNGTLEAKYQRLGNIVVLSIHLVIGSTTTLGTGNWSFSLPITSSAAVGGQGIAHLRDSGTNNYERSVHVPPNVSVLTFFQQLDNATNVNNISSTVPFSWATGDSLDVTVTYFVD